MGEQSKKSDNGWRLTIELSALKAILLKELEHLENLGYQRIEIPEDYYWNIPSEYLYDPSKEPKDLSIGQLSFDWDDLQKVLNGENDPLGYHLIWLSTILRAIGENISG